MKVEVFYVDGCPNHQPIVERVKTVLEDISLIADVMDVRVTDSASAMAVGFLGSPTVRVNGVDVEPSSRTSDHFGLMCRTYLDGPRREGVPSIELIRRALLEAFDQHQAHMIDAP